MSQFEIIKATVAQQLSTDELERLVECGAKIQAILAEYPGLGVIAIALIGAKLSEE